MIDANSLKELEAFVADSQLQQLETALTRFNIFQAIGAKDREVCHSDFLAYLLDPEWPHGLGDAFLKLFLHTTLPDLAAAASFAHPIVRREYRCVGGGIEGEQVDTTSTTGSGYIDILLEDEQAEAAVIIENKIWSAEGQDQLHFYWMTIRREHPEWSIFGVYLTPSGQEPKEARDRGHYKALSYSTLMPMLTEVLRTRRGQLAAGVELVLKDYLDLWRSILGNTEAETLARQLYSRHYKALEIINKAAWRKNIDTYLQGLIPGYEALRLAEKPTEYIHFTVKAWDDAVGTGTAFSDLPLLYFSFYNLKNSLTLCLNIQPGSPEDVRKQIADLAQRTGSPFHKPKKLAGGWVQLYEQSFLKPRDYEKYSDDGLTAAIDKEWQRFVDQHLPAIIEVFKHQDWFWQPAKPQHDES